MSRQGTKDKKAARATAQAEAFIDAAVGTAVKRSRQRTLSVTAEELMRERDVKGLSWAQVAANLGLGSPGAARSAYTALTGKAHDTSQPLLKRSSKNLVGRHTAQKEVEWDDDTDQEEIITAITHHNILVRRMTAGLELPEEVLHVSRVQRFEYSKGGYGELQVLVYTKDACECRVQPKDADYGVARAFRVADIKEVS